MSEHILQFSTALRGEPQGVLRVSSMDDLAAADEVLDALLSAGTLDKMVKVKDLLKLPDAVELIKTELGGQVISETPPPEVAAPAAPQAVPAQCNLGTRGAHAMACKSCAGPLSPRKAMGNFFGHECLSNGKSDQNPNGCKPTWCN